jgi:hypothetical protein
MNASTRYLTTAILLTLSGAVQAETTFELGVGQATGVVRPDGNWYQARFAHRLDLQSDALLVGLRADLSDHVALHAGAFRIGANRSDAQAVTHDALYTPRSETGCPGVCPAMATFRGRGDVVGVRALLEVHTGGAWQFGLLAGPIVYRTRWTQTIPDWYPSAPDGRGGYTAGALQPLHIEHSRWAVSGAAGLRVTHGRAFAELMWYRDGASASPDTYFPGIWKSHTVVTVGASF